MSKLCRSETMDWHIDDGNKWMVLVKNYVEMSSHLKACFTYFTFFPQGYDFSAECVMQMWIAAGFIPEMVVRTLEQTADYYLDELVERCMVRVSSTYADGSIKTVRVNDFVLPAFLRLTQALCAESKKLKRMPKIEKDQTALQLSEGDGSKSYNTELHKRRIESWDRARGKQLGAGSYGTVYEAISDEGFFFAVKEVLIDQGANAQKSITELQQEIDVLSQLEHENIVQYYGSDKEETKLYIFQELVTQGSLVSLYKKYVLKATQVSAYTRQILHALVYLHERNIIHRDIKCANILVNANGLVKLADFGLAKKMTKFNIVKSSKGSAYWMAPEVVNEKINNGYGQKADIWSLGCTVLEMLTRDIPYPNTEPIAAIFKIGKGEQPPIPDHLSTEARDFIKKCVTVKPAKRPSAVQLLKHPFVKIQS